ncbi:MAG: serine protease [Treponema sp.]|nr:serine protease [Treponema sp.]
MKNILKKLFLAGIISCFFSPFCFSAAIKDSVCIVRGNLSDSTVKFLEQYKNEIKQKGYVSYSLLIDSYLKGRFGSGFVCYASNGKRYIITNRHVVNNFDSVNVQFENEDGSYTDYKGLKILALSDTLDIAIIEVPAGFNKPALSFSNGALKDGYDVISAGFPGLGNEPMWQLGKGSVTNAKARIKELLDPSVSTLIQHSAEVDSGNSGGPLLIKDNSAAGYSVVGVNTWKASYRQNTNFSIPAAVIKKFLNEAVSKSNSAATIDLRLEEFKKVLDDSEKDYSFLAEFISSDMVLAKGGDAFISVLQKAPSEIKNRVVYTFNEDPLEGLKHALCYDIWKKLHIDDGVKEYSVETSKAASNETSVNFKIAEQDIKSKWILNQGRWCLYEIAEINEKPEIEKKGKGKAGKNADTSSTSSDNSLLTIENPFEFSISGGPAFNKNSSVPLFQINADALLQYITMGFCLYSTRMSAPVDTFSDNYVMQNLTLSGANVGLRLPLKSGIFIFEPKLNFCLCFVNLFQMEKVMGVGFGIGGGLEITIICSEAFGIVIGTDYIHTFFKKNSAGNLNVTAGIKFSVSN